MRPAPEPAPRLRRPELAILAVIVLGGALARFWNLGWDGGAGNLHPDEWALNNVVRRLGPDLNPHFFFYGALPLYLDRATAEALGRLTGLDWLAWERLPLIGRAWSALESVAMLPLIFVAGRRLGGAAVGLTAAACAAGAALLIQAAHFGTVDTALTLAGVALLALSLRILDGAGRRVVVLSGGVLGLALATKLTAATFVLLPLLALWRAPAPAAPERARRAALLLVVAGVVTALAAPYYLLAWPELWDAVRAQSAELGGDAALSYTWQFSGAPPYLFELRNLVAWSLGLPLGAAALLGWAGALVVAARRRAGPLLLLAVWPTLYLAYIGLWQARFVRHTLPLLPFCCLFAAWGAGALVARAGGARMAGRALLVALAGGAALWGLAFCAIYAAPDTRLAATAWVHAHVAPGARLVVEDPNTLVPVPDAAHPVTLYQYAPLAVTAPDTPEEAATLAAALASGDWLITPNRRWAGVLPRLPAFPTAGRYYRLLAAGRLGYAPAAVFSSPPRLGPLAWPDDAAEETFQVFDHPTVRIYRNVARLPAAALRALLAAPR
jgi:hypothetical protein